MVKLSARTEIATAANAIDTGKLARQREPKCQRERDEVRHVEIEAHRHRKIIFSSEYCHELRKSRRAGYELHGREWNRGSMPAA